MRTYEKSILYIRIQTPDTTFQQDLDYRFAFFHRISGPSKSIDFLAPICSTRLFQFAFQDLFHQSNFALKPSTVQDRPHTQKQSTELFDHSSDMLLQRAVSALRHSPLWKRHNLPIPAKELLCLFPDKRRISIKIPTDKSCHKQGLDKKQR